MELTEEEAYERIEEEIGILALRLGSKPRDMRLKDVFIDAETGEALMEFQYDDHILTIYANKQIKEASFNAQLDGKLIETIETFYLEKSVEVVEIDNNDGVIFYRTQIEHANAYYLLSSDMKLEQFESILYDIIFKNE